MRLHFYIETKGKSKLRFDTAGDLDTYIKTHRLPAGAIIILKNGNLIIGQMRVKRYLEIEKEINQEVKK